MRHLFARVSSQASTTIWAALSLLILAGIAGCGGSGAKKDAAADGSDGSGAVDGGTDVAVPAPATTIPTAALSFGMVACGTAGGNLPLSFTNTGVGTLHYRASIAPGGMLYSLQGAMADGSLSGDVAPEASATLIVVAGTVPATAGSGASFPGSLVITTNAAGAETNSIPLALTADGATCAVSCGALTRCTPSTGAPYCANTMTDNGHCGTCGTVCGTGQVCSDGACSLTCGALTKCMPSTGVPYCANMMTDNVNCGTCGTVCGAGQVCSGGACSLTCGALTKCMPSTGAPYCANMMTDNANCGACGNLCGAGQACSSGVCTLTCGALTKCTPSTGAATCASTSTDNANCGTCGNTCPSGQVCSAGVCTVTCGALTKCTLPDGAAYCANTFTSRSDCGTCDHSCGPGQVCVAGSCQASCSKAQTVCGGMCTNTSFDPANCGSCGHACAFANASAACLGAGCYLAACDVGFLDCNGSQADGCEINKNTSAANCGACGRSCWLGESCNAGVCTANLSPGLIGYWDMDEATGSKTALDSSPNHLDGMVQGGVSFMPGAGRRGSGAATFAGGYIRVAFPNNARGEGTGVAIPRGDITFAMWFKTSAPALGGLQVVVAAGGACDRAIGDGVGNLLNFNTFEEVNLASTIATNDGVWHHMAYVLDRTNGFSAYIDGVLDASSTTPTVMCGVGCSDFDWAWEYWIGRAAYCRFNADFFTGMIDDVRFYDHPLSAAGVAQLYNATR